MRRSWPRRVGAVDIVTAHPIVDAVLDRHRDALGDDLSAYRNHVYRCLTYHQLLLGFSIPDAAALAWSTHDLGIWTAGTFDYLTPSADLAVTKTAPATITAGVAYDYTVTVTNNGPSNATGTVLSDTLPAGATFVGATGATCTAAVSCPLPMKVVVRAAPFQRTVAPDTKPVPFTVRVNAGPPATALFGESEVRFAGAGALVIVKGRALDAAAPGFTTVT